MGDGPRGVVVAGVGRRLGAPGGQRCQQGIIGRAIGIARIRPGLVDGQAVFQGRPDRRLVGFMPLGQLSDGQLRMGQGRLVDMTGEILAAVHGPFALFLPELLG